jgi:hypothetical protein
MANPKPTKLPKWATSETPVPTWSTSTAYLLDAIVRAGTNVYVCVQAGTSASSGSGPTGTGNLIPDGVGTLRWAYVGVVTSQSKVEPSAWKKITGWLYGESPPANIANWLFNNLYTWTQYLDTFTQASQTWTGTQTFTSLIFDGLFTLAAPGVTPQLLMNFPGASRPTRLYYQGGGYFLMTYNASWNAGLSKWMPDVGNEGAFAAGFGVTGLSLYKVPSSVGAGWATFGSAVVSVDGDRGLQVANTNSTTAGYVSGRATIPAGSPSVFVNINPSYVTQHSNAFAVLRSFDATLKYITRVECMSQQIYIEGNANASTNTTVQWFVFNNSAGV